MRDRLTAYYGDPNNKMLKAREQYLRNRAMGKR